MSFTEVTQTIEHNNNIEIIQKTEKQWREEKQRKINIKEYKNNSKNFLLTSRFSDMTWNENKIYREKYKNIGCVYCSPEMITRTIPTDTILFILEMNNDTNKIMGLGMVKNNPSSGKYYVYENGNYNRYVYVGKNRIERDSMTPEEEEIMKVFDILCFTGNQHMKRGQGLKAFPTEMLYNCSKKMDLVDFIGKMFKRRLLCRNKE